MEVSSKTLKEVLGGQEMYLRLDSPERAMNKAVRMKSQR
jgi:hypothetical protein